MLHWVEKFRANTRKENEHEYENENKIWSRSCCCIDSSRLRVSVLCTGGAEMSVTERKAILEMAVDEYGFNKVVSVIAATISGALIGFTISMNVIPNKSKENRKGEI